MCSTNGALSILARDKSFPRSDILAQACERNLRGPDTEAELSQGCGDLVPTGCIGPSGVHEYGGEVLIFWCRHFGSLRKFVNAYRYLSGLLNSSVTRGASGS